MTRMLRKSETRELRREIIERVCQEGQEKLLGDELLITIQQVLNYESLMRKLALVTTVQDVLHQPLESVDVCMGLTGEILAAIDEDQDHVKLAFCRLEEEMIVARLTSLCTEFRADFEDDVHHLVVHREDANRVPGLELSLSSAARQGGILGHVGRVQVVTSTTPDLLTRGEAFAVSWDAGFWWASKVVRGGNRYIGFEHRCAVRINGAGYRVRL